MLTLEKYFTTIIIETHISHTLFNVFTLLLELILKI